MCFLPRKILPVKCGYGTFDTMSRATRSAPIGARISTLRLIMSRGVVLTAGGIGLGILAAFVKDPLMALVLIGVVLFGFQVWINNVQTLPSDFFPDKAVASVAGLGGVGAGLGSMIFTFATGWVVDHFSYTPVLTVAGLLAPLGTVVLFTLAGPIKRVSQAHDGTAAN